ncbi:hypothetical protein SD81_025000 [Tolypothrix campylonemoides VB511288]|nr:hypothetical protein SD81_025000 [Tolypothrix campylonemoides VB511288]
MTSDASLWCGCTDTNAYAYGTSDDERSNWCGVSPNDKTDNPSGMPSARLTANASRLRRETLLQRWLTGNW